MPILSINGDVIPRNMEKPSGGQKKHGKIPKPYLGKNAQSMKHNRGVTESQAKYLIEMQEAAKLKAILRDEI